jgi:hypothetical protein
MPHWITTRRWPRTRRRYVPSAAAGSGAPWYDSNWLYRKKLTVPATNVAGSAAITGHILYFDPSADSDIAAEARVDGRDILFTTSDGETKLPHELLPAKQFTTPDGAWSFYSAPVAVYFNGTAERLYVGCHRGNWETSNVQKVIQYTYSTGAIVETVVGTVDVLDDHNNPALLVRSLDNRLIVFYTEHGTENIKWKISTNVEDATAWGTENNADPATADGYTYCNPFELTEEGNIYLFSRATGGANVGWGYTVSADDGASFTGWTRLAGTTGSDAWGSVPYFRFWSNGVDRIDVAASTSQPGSEAGAHTWRIVHFYYQDGNWFDSDGTDIGDPPFDVSEITEVYEATGDDEVWITDLTYDESNRPHLVFHVFVAGSFTNMDAYEGEFNGSTWATRKIVDDGGDWGVDGYPGLTALDPLEDDVAWVSRDVSGIFEIGKYRKTSGTWALETAITQSSTHHNVRPIVVKGCPLGKRGRIQFMTVHTYTTFENYKTALTAYPALGSHFRHAYIRADIHGGSDVDIYVYYGNPAATDQQNVAGTWADYIRVYHTQEKYGTVPGYLVDVSGNGSAIDEYSGDVWEDVNEPSANVGRSKGMETTGWSMGSPNMSLWTGVTNEIFAKSPLTSAANTENTLISQQAQTHCAWRLESSDDSCEAFIWLSGDRFPGGTMSISPTADTWQYHAFTWNPTDGLKVRIDKNESSAAGSSTTGTLHNDTSLAMKAGAEPAAIDPFVGNLAEIRVRDNSFLSKDITDTQWDNWDLGNTFYTIGGEETEGAAASSGSGAFTFGNLETSATGTFTAPVYSGAAAVTFGNLETTAAATFTAPVYSGAAAQTFGNLETSATASFAASVHQGSAALTFGNLETTATGTFVAPVFSGAAAQTFGHLETTATGTFVAPVYSGSAAQTFGGVETSATAIFATQVFSGAGAVTFGGFETTATGTVAAAVFSATASQTFGNLETSATGTFTEPVYSGTATLAFGGFESIGAALFGSSVISGTGPLVLPGFSITGVGEFIFVAPPLVHHVHLHGGPAVRLHGHVKKVTQSR